MRIRNTRKFPAAAAVALLLTAGLTGTASAAPTPEPMSAALGPCWTPSTSPNDWAFGAHHANDTWFRSGPYANCSGYYKPGPGWVDYACRHINDVGNLWYYTDWGWVYSANVTFPYGAPSNYCS
ncbi:hypothetical protein [Herbidospora sp. NBRC 101105]|uniref:hypothetical protein n=1 Tax=Herbidospora sp. NBRC 101105 TaxID=3032195 RepID=UPI0024A4E9E7|nr:hypothetical protein [Herbidospora sp. NBRC 101105]GLX96676.1 hypothetical protein Hesp01_46260 [Herbidospora sp. NBRC 101105]